MMTMPRKICNDNCILAHIVVYLCYGFDAIFYRKFSVTSTYTTQQCSIVPVAALVTKSALRLTPAGWLIVVAACYGKIRR